MLPLPPPPLPPKKIQKNTTLYIYLTKNFKIKRTNEIRKEIDKKIEKQESWGKEKVKPEVTMKQMCGYLIVIYDIKY